MFESLSDRLNETFRNLTGRGALSERNIEEAMNEIRIALLEADVNYQVVKDFIAEVREECLGEKVLRGINPGQMTIKIVYDHMVKLMGEAAAPLQLTPTPAFIMMVGLHGSGKTTTSAKLALHLKQNEKKKVMLVAADLMRPAAIDQLETLANQVGVEFYADRNARSPIQVAMNVSEIARSEKFDVVIFDTAGRLQIDESLVRELVDVRNVIQPNEILLVADAALGQEAVSVATHFNDALDISGIVLTKLDGDARGGAALSMRKVTGKPIKLVGVGEKMEDLQMFHPDRMADRILGMGDVVSLVESIQQKVDEDEAARLEERIKRNELDFNDFLKQVKLLRNLGGLSRFLDFIPGGGNLLKNIKFDDKQVARVEAIILSMTAEERKNPQLLIQNPSRQERVARGSGLPLEAVSQMLVQFNQAKKMLGNVARSGALDGDGMLMPQNLQSYARSSSPEEIEKRRKQRKKERQQRKKNRKKKKKR